jgi:hypothetical protein
MIANLKEAGLKALEIQKVLGPLEKITMMSVISLIALFERFRMGNLNSRKGLPIRRFLALLFGCFNRFYCAPVWLDARLAPRCLSSVLLIRAVRRNGCGSEESSNHVRSTTNPRN